MNQSLQKKNIINKSLQKINKTSQGPKLEADVAQSLLESNPKQEKKNSKLQKIKNEDLTPFDFINMIRTDPEMQDEFCYLNKRNHAYDFKIVEFNERNINEYPLYLDT